MLRSLKNRLYFLVAWYFRFFASIRLSRWKPRIVVLTGSNGKTTALHLVELQVGGIARYSHYANSSFGIPFDILGLKRMTYSPFEWITLGLQAPFSAWKKPYNEKIYVVEADCDRPGEGVFLSSFLKPEVVVWLNCARTHTQNFERAVRAGTSASVDEAIAHEFGYFLERAEKLAIINGDNPLILKETRRTKAEIFTIKESRLQQYAVHMNGTDFTMNDTTYRFPFLLPQEVFYSIAASARVAEYFGVRPANDLSGFAMPPGRSSIFKGINNTTIVDSSYNANVDSVAAILRMTEKLPAEKKWLILGDLTEQGASEKEEHEKIAPLVSEVKFRKVILVGPRLKKYAAPLLHEAVSFEGPREALDHIASSMTGGEMLVFKGARFLEGIIEHLLQNKADANKLCRREKIWQMRRTQWGL
jgi:UDP-N-acetylmuramyl pentapeptide synthase